MELAQQLTKDTQNKKELSYRAKSDMYTQS